MNRDIKKFDFVLFGTVVILCLFGTILLASASKVNIHGLFAPETRIFTMQIFWVISGLLVMFLAAFIHYPFICKFYIPIYLLNIALLLGVLILKRVTGKSVLREIRFSGGFGIMPSEFSKIFMIIFLSTVIAKYKDRINEPKVLFLIGLCGLLPFYLILKQPSMSAAVVSIVVLVIMVFVGGLNYKYIVVALAIFLPLAGFLYYDINREDHIIVDEIFKPYQLENRIKPFFSPDEGEVVEQTEAGIYAIGSGGVSGKGLFKNDHVVPESKNDFIFSILGAEFGFIGSVTVLLLVFIVVVKCLLVSMGAVTFQGRLIAAGVATIFAFQVFVNVGVNIGILPNTGMAFPFLSAGGSAMWINMALVGLVLNVKMEADKNMFDDLD